MDSYVESFLENFTGVTEAGPQSWKVMCPGHFDVRPSLHISIGQSGKLVGHCHGGCTAVRWMAAAGVTFQDMLNEGSNLPSKGKQAVLLTEQEITLRHKVYSFVLRSLDLDAADRDGLVRRGFNRNDLYNWPGYRSFEWFMVERAAAVLFRELGADLFKVPGFFLDPDTQRVRTLRINGLVIPVR